MKLFTVFYAGLIYGEYDTLDEFRLMRASCGPEIYNGAYFYLRGDQWNEPGWYGMDGIPAMEHKITPEMKATLLLLG